MCDKSKRSKQIETWRWNDDGWPSMTCSAHRLQNCLNVKIRISFTHLRFSHPGSGLFRQTIDCKASREDTQEKPEGLGRWLKAAPDQTVCCVSYSWSSALSLHLATQDWLGDGELSHVSPHLESTEQDVMRLSKERLQGISGWGAS